MENKTLKTAFRRGFTLIELMIVIVILGILMGTILPRITGAQSRARDTARQADLNSIAQAMELYYDDFGAYPGTNATYECLDPDVDTGTSDLIKEYFKGSIIPSPPTGETNVLPAVNCEGAYAYAPIKNRGVLKNGFILAADVEIYQNANIIATDAAIATLDVDTDVQEIVDAIQLTTKTLLKDADDLNANNTIYVLVN